MKTIEELRARLAEIRDELSTLDDEYQGKRFDAEAKDRWNQLNAERDDVTATIEELETRAAQIERAAKDPKQVEGGKTFNVRVKQDDVYDLTAYRSQASTPEEEIRLLNDGARRALEATHLPHEGVDEAKAKAHVERLLGKDLEGIGGEKDRAGVLARHLLVTGSPVYGRAFSKALAGRPLTSQEADSLARALGLSGSSGGYAVPFALDPTIILTSDGEINPIRQIARVEQVTVNEYKLVTSAGITAAYAAEGTEASDNSPSLGQPDLICDRAQAFVPYSIEIGGDWGALGGEMAALLQDAKDVLEADKFTNGAGHGSNEPKGLLTGVNAGTVTTAATATFAVADLYSVRDALGARFRAKASWMAEGAQFSRVRQFDTNGGADLWVQLAYDDPATLIGKPAYENTTMDSTIASGDDILVYGDFRHFIIVDRLGMTVEVIPHLFGGSGRPTGKRGIYAVWRNTSDVLTPSAFKKLRAK